MYQILILKLAFYTVIVASVPIGIVIGEQLLKLEKIENTNKKVYVSSRKYFIVIFGVIVLLTLGTSVGMSITFSAIVLGFLIFLYLDYHKAITHRYSKTYRNLTVGKGVLALCAILSFGGLQWLDAQYGGLDHEIVRFR